MLASAESPLEHVLDQPWRLGGQTVQWMSSQIAVMLIVGLLLAVAVPLLARRRGMVPKGPYRLVEAVVVFVRDRIAAPTIGRGGEAYVPYLATLLVFLLGCNLIGLLPLWAVSQLLGLRDTPVGGTATGSMYVCAAMAGATLAMVIFSSYVQAVRILWKGPPQQLPVGLPQAGLNLFLAAGNALRRRCWPLPLALPGAVVVWLNGFVPAVPGLVGLFLWPVLLVLEWVGYVARCFALCIRLFANMTAGHILLAAVVAFAAAARGWAVTYVGLPAAAGAVGLMLLEALVAVIQAYIFTLLSGLFIGLAASPHL